MALGPFTRGPSGLIGLLGLTNDGRFPAQLSELVAPGMDYMPFLAAGVGFRVFQQLTAITAPNTVSLVVPQDRRRLVWGIGTTVLSTGATANWQGTLTLGFEGLVIPITNFELGSIAANQVKASTLWLPTPIMLPPGSDISHNAYVGAINNVVTVSAWGIEFPA